jgi:hypothetical protein
MSYMNRDDFAAFTAKTLDEVVQLAEQNCGHQLPRRIAFRWMGHSHPVVRENIVEHIVSRVFVDDEHIFPCVDIGVGDVLEDGTLLIIGHVAGYAPQSFGRNWTRRDGPFVHIVGAPFLNKMAGKKDLWSADKPFGCVIPDVAKPH